MSDNSDNEQVTAPVSKGAKKVKAVAANGDKKTRRPNKPKKDANAPKRPKNAYMFFAADKRAEVGAAFPDLKMTEQSKKIGAMWKDLTEKSKEPYVKLSEEDKVRYTAAVALLPPGSQPKKAKPAAKKGAAAAAAAAAPANDEEDEEDEEDEDDN